MRSHHLVSVLAIGSAAAGGVHLILLVHHILAEGVSRNLLKLKNIIASAHVGGDVGEKREAGMIELGWAYVWWGTSFVGRSCVGLV